MGIGEFITALGIKVLKNKGVEIIEFVTLSQKAKALWQKFGVDEVLSDLDVNTAVNHEYVKTSLEKFII